MLDHILGEWVTTKDPTCAESGEQTRTCAICNTMETQDIPSLGGHDVYCVPSVEPTCTETGKTAGSYCYRCGTIFDAQQIIPALGHNFSEWIISKAPTATSLGEKYRKCKTCGEVETESVPATGEHNVVKLPAVAATCTKTGLTSGSYCSICGEVFEVQKEIPAYGHKEIVVKGTPATCTSSGATNSSYCDYCGITIKKEQQIEKLGHNLIFDSINSVTQTCTTEGRHVANCSREGCGYQSVSVLPATGHITDNSPWVTLVDATCTSSGVKIAICEKCSEALTETIPATSHDFEGAVCKNCGLSNAVNCNCNCHKSGISGILWKLINIFNKLLKRNPVCACGESHY